MQQSASLRKSKQSCDAFEMFHSYFLLKRICCNVKSFPSLYFVDPCDGNKCLP